MDPFTIAAAAAGAGGLAVVVRRRATRLAAWRAAAQACGLQDVVKRRRLGVIPSGITGRAGPLAVTIESGRRRDQGSGTRIRVHEGLAPISLRRKGLDTTVQKQLRQADEASAGDPAFDSAVYAEGSPVVVQAVLDQGTRVAVRQLLVGALYDTTTGKMFRVKARLRGQLEVAFDEDDAVFLQTHLPIALRAVLDLAQRLAAPGDLADRLARNAREDPLSSVRLRNLAKLKDGFADHPAVRTALRDACSDANDVVRLYAATSLGPEGREVVRRLAASAEEDSCAARAVAALGREMSATEALELLATALQRRRHTTAGACIDVLAGRGGAESVEALARVLGDEKGAVAVAAARALAHPDLPGTEAVLWGRGLKHSDASVRVAAADGLGSVGSVAAVLPLQEAAERHGGAMSRAARQAVAAIQARLSGAAPGQLSVSTEAGGALSIASEGGEISLDVERDPR